MHTYSTHSLITPSVNSLVASRRIVRSARHGSADPRGRAVELSRRLQVAAGGEGMEKSARRRQTDRYADEDAWRVIEKRRYCSTREKGGCLSCDNVANMYSEAADCDVGQDYFAPRIDL